MNVVVLAGGPHDELAETQPGAANKAFVKIGGVTLVERTLRALRTSPTVGEITVVAPISTHGDSALALADHCRPDGAHISDSLRNGLADFAPNETVLIATSDLPILSVESVEDFIARAKACDPEIGYGCVEKSVHMARFPQVPHTWAPLRDGTYCGGGLMVIKPRALPNIETFIERLGAARKNPLQLAGLFGWDMLLRFAIRRLSIAQAEARATKIVGATARAIISPYAETGVNVDRLSDIALAEHLVKA